MFILSVNYSKVYIDTFTNLAIREGRGNLLSLEYSEASETTGIYGASCRT